MCRGSVTAKPRDMARAMMRVGVVRVMVRVRASYRVRVRIRPVRGCCKSWNSCIAVNNLALEGLC